MTEKEFTKEMQRLGWKDDYIKEILREYEEEKKNGVNMPLEMHLIEAPISD